MPEKESKKQILLRLPPKLYDMVMRMAEDEFRSVNGQIEYLLTDAVKKRYSDYDSRKNRIESSQKENESE